MANDLLDLHGFIAEDVEATVDAFIMKVNLLKLKRARIMTGKGTGKVRQIVIEYLKRAGYPWEYERIPKGRHNEGVLVIFLD